MQQNKSYPYCMFDDISTLHPQSSVAVKQAEQVYGTLLWDTLQNDDNTWRIEQYLKNLRDSKPSFD